MYSALYHRKKQAEFIGKSRMSCVKMMNSKGPSTLPSVLGPLVTGNGLGKHPFTLTHCTLPSK